MLWDLTDRPRQNRRQWKRQWFNAPIRVLADRTAIEGLGINVSEGGMYLFAVADLAVGSHIRIEFNAPSQQPVKVCGTIKNRAVYLYGVEFLLESACPSGH